MYICHVYGINLDVSRYISTIYACELKRGVSVACLLVQGYNQFVGGVLAARRSTARNIRRPNSAKRSAGVRIAGSGYLSDLDNGRVLPADARTWVLRPPPLFFAIPFDEFLAFAIVYSLKLHAVSASRHGKAWNAEKIFQ